MMGDMDPEDVDGTDPLDPETEQEFRALARQHRSEAEQELAEIEYETELAEIKQRDLTGRSMLAMMEGERWQGQRLTIGIELQILGFV